MRSRRRVRPDRRKFPIRFFQRPKTNRETAFEKPNVFSIVRTFKIDYAIVEIFRTDRFIRKIVQKVQIERKNFNPIGNTIGKFFH